MKQIPNNFGTVFRVIALIASAVLIIPLLFACQDDIITDNNTGFDLVDESPEGCFPVLSTTRFIQMGKEFIYFAGESHGIFKYDVATGDVSEYCTDPLCLHCGKNSSCRIANHTAMQYFRAYSNMLIYVATYNNSEKKLTNYVLAYDPDSMKNVELDDNASTSNRYCTSDKYVYYTNAVLRDGVAYFNHKQVSILDGSVKIFGQERKEAAPYILMGAAYGFLYAQSEDDGMTYVCSEDSPGKFSLFWKKPISNIWAKEDELFFRSRDPENDDGRYFFYHTDIEGNVLNKQEIIGDMRWCSFYDGRYLYYIPAEEDEFINSYDNTVTKIHWRDLYCLDMETGERTVAFSFDGDYATVALQLSMGNDIIVRDDKIYTYKITEQSGYWSEGDKKWISGGKQLALDNGIIIIDMKSGDITHITADYNTKGELSTNIDYYEMDLLNEVHE